MSVLGVTMKSVDKVFMSSASAAMLNVANTFVWSRSLLDIPVSFRT
jgi:hypothetical protein